MLLLPAVFADNQEKTERKALEQQAKTFIKEAKELEKAGKLTSGTRELHQLPVVY